MHILFNNGGVMNPPIDSVTAQGYDQQFGTNTLGHFFFTILLVPTLLATIKNPATPKGTVRVVTTSSLSYMFAPEIKWDTLRDGPERKKQSIHFLYGQSKLVR